MSKQNKNRIAKILSHLNSLGVLDVEMIQQLNIDGLGETTKRNVLRVMDNLEKEGYIKSIRHGVKLFMLPDYKLTYIDHRLMINRFIVNNGYNKVARIEPTVKINGEQFKPDFMIPKVQNPKLATDWKYFEVDRKQKKKTNMQKIQRYKDFGLQFEVVCGIERTYMWKGYVYHVV